MSSEQKTFMEGLIGVAVQLERSGLSILMCKETRRVALHLEQRYGQRSLSALTHLQQQYGWQEEKNDGMVINIYK